MGALYRDLVRKHSKAKGSARALLNILADYATDEGLAWPTRSTLASDTGMSERNVTRCLQTLCHDGRLSIEGNGAGGRGRVPQYKIWFPELKDSAPVNNRQEAVKGDKLSPKRETTCHPLDEQRVTNEQIKGDKLVVKGDKCASIPSYVRSEPQEPTTEPKGERAPARIASPREPSSKELIHKSPHLDPRHFVNGYIPPGKGTNPVEVYYERFSLNQDAARLNAIKEDDLATLCPDLDKLREAVTAYSRTAFQLGNVQLILDWYRDGIPERHKQPLNGAHKSGSLSEAEKGAMLTRAKNARSEIRTLERFGGHIDPELYEYIEQAKAYGL